MDIERTAPGDAKASLEKVQSPVATEDIANLKHASIDEHRNVGTLDRKLKSRHIQFLALSGAIGTGLFVGSGQVLSLAGPLSAFLAYAITGFNLFCVINGLGEMATYLPIPGAVPVFAARFVDPALGFCLGWNYFYQLAIGVSKISINLEHIKLIETRFQ